MFNDRQEKVGNVSKIENVCNAVAGELIVPKEIFLKKWDIDMCNIDIFQKVTDLAKYFRCGEIVIARKAVDCNKIGLDVYNQVAQTAIKNYKQMKDTIISRLDGCFIRALCESINIGRTTYTEAYRLTNTNCKTFSIVAQGLGGVEW